jgi:hypothetical protein
MVRYEISTLGFNFVYYADEKSRMNKPDPQADSKHRENKAQRRKAKSHTQEGCPEETEQG